MRPVAAWVETRDRAASPDHGRVESVNVGEPRQIEWAGRIVETAIWKQPVATRVAVHGVNLEGDDQADRRVHGGVDKAVYAYSSEDYEWWGGHLGREVKPGTFGENLTVSGLALDRALIGERWLVGSVLLQVSQPRLPCYKLGIRMEDQGFVDTFEAAERFGVYLRVIEEGTIGAGDNVDVISRPDHDLTVTELGRASPRPSPRVIDRILAVPEVPDSWRKWAERARDRHSRVPN